MSERAAILRGEYPHLATLPTRWSDNDIYGHVNNVVYYAFFDTAINQYLIAEGGLDIGGGDVIGVAVETHCQFMRSVAFPEEIEVGLRVGRLGRSSVRYELAIFKQGEDEASAAGHFVHVFVDRATRRSVPIPAGIRGALERLLPPAP
ncbi:MAG TPA: thioesterase family protein [Herpetosiphonaceae bacterium]|nr:thioesterase family protein [Herpetosiphonaceae bacterium]